MALLESFRRSVGSRGAVVALGLSLVVAVVGAPPAAGFAQAGADVAVGYSFVTPWSASATSVNVNVQSSGPGAASGVVVTFTVPDGAAVISGEQMTYSGSAATLDRRACDVAVDRRALRCAMPIDLPQPGGLAASAVVANVGLPAGSTIDVRVEVSAAVADPDPSNNVRDFPITFSGPPVPVDVADLALTLAYPPVPGADPAVVAVNFSLAYTGPAPATDIVVTVRAPAGAVVAPRWWTGNDPVSCPLAEPTEVLVCTTPRWDKGGNIPLSVSVSVINVGLPAGSRIDVEASVTLAEQDPTPDDHRVTVPVTFATGPVPTIPGVATAQLALQAPYAPRLDPQPPFDPSGHAVVFVWRATSSGPSPVGQVRVVLNLGPGLRPLAGYPFGTFVCTAGPAGTAFDCLSDRPLLPGGALEISVAAAYDVVPGATLSAEAFVASELADPAPADNHLVQRVVVPDQASSPSSTSAPAATTSIPTVSDVALPATGRSTAAVVLAAGALVALGLALRSAGGRTRRHPA